MPTLPHLADGSSGRYGTCVLLLYSNKYHYLTKQVTMDDTTGTMAEATQPLGIVVKIVGIEKEDHDCLCKDKKFVYFRYLIPTLTWYTLKKKVRYAEMGF